MHGFTPGPHRGATTVGVMWGINDQITAADDGYLQIVGYTRDDLEQGRINWRAMTPPEFVHLDEAGMRQAAATGGFTVPYQKQFIRKDGTRVPVLICCAFVPGIEGGWMGHLVDLSIRDTETVPLTPAPAGPPVQPVTEEFQRRLIGELVNERTSMLAMLDSSPSMFWAVDHRFRLIGANTAFQQGQRQAIGRQLDIGESVLRAELPDPLRTTWQGLYERALAGEHVTYFATEEVAGTRYRFDHILAPMRDASGSIYGVTCASHDVGDRLAAEDALRASEVRFRTLASASPLGICLTDDTGAVIYANERMQAIWQLPAAAMLGEGTQQRLHPDDVAMVRSVWAEAIERKQDVQMEFRLVLPDRSIRHIRAWVSALPDDGNTNGFVASIEDATEAHAFEQRTRQRERLESLGTLAGGIAHDFNNMLGIVLGYTELGLTDRKLSPTLATDLQEIRTASLRARDLVRQILTFSRHSDTAHTPVDMAALTRESVRLLRATVPAHIDVRVHVPEGTVTVLGNASALQQVIVNLCVNAEHALRTTDAPVITVALEPHVVAGAASVTLRIHDNGTGMPSDVADRIFEPFFTTKQIGEGTGMGLAVVHGTVLAHGGTISVDTAPSRGTSFVITMPACDISLAAELPVGPALRGSGHILLVDDEPQLAKAVSASLERAGFQVTTCHTGDDALQRLAEGTECPDVVVSDVAMPGVTGDRLAQLLESRYPNLPVVLMTGYSERVTPDGPRGPNVIAILQKPVSAAALASVLDHVLT